LQEWLAPGSNLGSGIAAVGGTIAVRASVGIAWTLRGRRQFLGIIIILASALAIAAGITVILFGRAHCAIKMRVQGSTFSSTRSCLAVAVDNDGDRIFERDAPRNWKISVLPSSRV